MELQLFDRLKGREVDFLGLNFVRNQSTVRNVNLDAKNQFLKATHFLPQRRGSELEYDVLRQAFTGWSVNDAESEFCKFREEKWLRC